MFHKLLSDTRFFLALLKFDTDLADKAGAESCGSCGGPLHKAPYPRKPRGIPSEIRDTYGRRFSFCCGRDGCRKRTTPPSVRFLGRRVYVGAMVVLVSAMRHGASRWRLRELKSRFGIGARTVQRWCRFWREIFRESAFWKLARARFAPPVDAESLPRSILDRMIGEDENRIVNLLRFLSPLTTCSGRPGHGL